MKLPHLTNRSINLILIIYLVILMVIHNYITSPTIVESNVRSIVVTQRTIEQDSEGNNIYVITAIGNRYTCDYAVYELAEINWRYIVTLDDRHIIEISD